MNRTRIYYTKDQIIKNLYTAGKEYQLESGEQYIGFYHKYIDGSVYTGSDWDDRLSKKLILFRKEYQQPEVKVYDTLKERQEYQSPYPVYNQPTQADRDRGFFTRYFIKPRNSKSPIDILEINETQFKMWKSFEIDPKLFDAIKIEWKIKGPKNDILDSSNSILEYGVEDTNKRTVNLTNLKFSGILYLLTDYTEFTSL